MRISNIRIGVAEALRKDQIKAPVVEILAKGAPKHGRLIYLVCDRGWQRVQAVIIRLLRDAEFSDVTETRFAKPSDLERETSLPDEKDQPYHNWRGRTLLASHILELTDRKIEERILTSYWVISVSKYEQEYFSMINVHPSFYHPSQSVPGNTSPRESIFHPMSHIRDLSLQGFLEKHDILRLGVVSRDKKLTYSDDVRIGEDTDWTRDPQFERLINAFSSKVKDKLG